MPSGHGERVSRKMQLAVAAILEYRTQTEAANAIGINVKTLGEWLRLPEFQAELQAEGRKLVQAAVARVQNLTGKAVTTLEGLLDSADEKVQLGAVRCAMETSGRGLELLDLCKRIAELESRAKGKRRP